MNVLCWGTRNFPASYSNGYLVERLKSSFGKFMVDTGIWFSNVKSPSNECLMPLRPSPSYSDVHTNQSFNQFYGLNTDLDLHWITNGFNGAFAMDEEYQLGTLTPPYRLRPHCWEGALMCSDCWDQFSPIHTDLMTVPSLTSPIWEVSM